METVLLITIILVDFAAVAVIIGNRGEYIDD